MPRKSQGFCVQGKSTQRALAIISCHGVQNMFRGLCGCNKIGFIGFTGGMHIETACCIFTRWQHIWQIVLPTEIFLRGYVASGRTIMARQQRPKCKQRGIMTFTHHSPLFGPLEWIQKSSHKRDISHWRPRSNKETARRSLQSRLQPLESLFHSGCKSKLQGVPYSGSAQRCQFSFLPGQIIHSEYQKR